jgi:hypothetical protein
MCEPLLFVKNDNCVDKEYEENKWTRICNKKVGVYFDLPPSSLIDSTMSPKWKQWKDKELGMFPGSQHFKDRGVCWSSKMGTRTNDKRINYSHEPAQTKQQVG